MLETEISVVSQREEEEELQFLTTTLRMEDLCFPQLLNASCRKRKANQSKAALIYVLYFICVLSVTLNLLVIISVSHFRQLHTPTNLLLISLAVSDFLTGLVLAPLQAHELTPCWLLGDLVCSLYYFASSLFTNASIGDMLLISVDRYVAICDPLHYSTRVTVRRVKMWICMCWTCCLLYSGLGYKDDLAQPGRFKSCYGECFIYSSNTDITIDIVLSFIAPITVMIILYMRVFVTAVSQARAMRSHVAAVTLQHSGTVMTKKSELKAARTLGVVLLVFLICFCPYYFFFFLFLQNIPVTASVGTLITVLMYINPCLNPVIYALFYPWFRKAIRLIFSLQILQPGSRETNML
ncbi:trace amine-associated receptor 8a-like [Channa argus]|uniref:trace amine-associated receptor 8a-like n=1 Tax=Channa argus TaxID=215402 RepID=UPI00352293A3